MDTTSQNSPGGRGVRHLIALGYPDPASEERAAADRRRAKSEALSRFDRLASSRRSAEASRVLSSLLEDWPEDVSIRLRAARFCHAIGDHRAALAHADEVMYAGVETPSAALLRGVALLGRRRITEAIDQLEYARRLRPPQPEVNGCLGEAYLRAGRDDEAEACFHAQLGSNPKDARAHQGLARLHCRWGDYEQAIDHALSAVEAAPRLWSAHCWLGISLAGDSQPHEAVRALETAATLAPNRAAPFRWLERLHLDRPEAAAEYTKQGRERIKRRILAAANNQARGAARPQVR